MRFIKASKLKEMQGRYGFYPMLRVLKELEDLGRFEECVYLKKLLQDSEKGREWYLSSKTDSLKYVLDNHLKFKKNEDKKKEYQSFLLNQSENAIEEIYSIINS